MNTKKNFISETLIIVACFIIFLGMSSISLTISATEDMMTAIYNLTTNEIKETKKEEKIEKTNDIEIQNTFVISADKFDVLEVKILPGNQTDLINNKKNFNLWDLDDKAREIIETILK